MKLKYVIFNMGKILGQLEYVGEGNVKQCRVNGGLTIPSRSYNLYSTIQRVDDTVVILLSEADEKHFESDEEVRFTNPRITAEGYKTGNGGPTNYIMHTDDMVKA